MKREGLLVVGVNVVHAFEVVGGCEPCLAGFQVLDSNPDFVLYAHCISDLALGDSFTG